MHYWVTRNTTQEAKTLQTAGMVITREIYSLDLVILPHVPHDRLSEFASELIRTYEGSIKSMDKLILKLYAKGLSTRDIADTVSELYGKNLSTQAITLITQEVEDERKRN